MKRFSLSRRTLLKGAGAAVALPLLEAMFDAAPRASAATPPRRLGIFFFGNGVRLDRWNPKATGAQWELSEELAPLKNVKEYVNVASGFTAKAGYGRRGHHDGCAALLSAIPFIELPHASGSYSSKFGGPSIDQVAASIIGRGTTFPSIEAGVSKRVVRGEGPTLQYMSHKGPDAPVPSEYNPARLFNMLFGGFSAPDTTDPRDGLRVSVLDAVNEDARRLQRRLGTADRQRLDAHLTSISELRKQILALPPAFTSACKKPDPVTESNVDTNGREPLEAVNRTVCDLIALAFACDLTRVATILFSGSVCGTVYYPVGATRGNHDLTHDSNEQELVHRMVTWTVERFAYLCERLKAIPEAGGNLLDNSALMLTTDVAEGLSHSSNDYPVVLVGRGGGVLKYPGVHYRSTTKENTSDVLLTLMQAAGTGLTEIGKDQGFSNRPCRPLMA